MAWLGEGNGVVPGTGVEWKPPSWPRRVRDVSVEQGSQREEGRGASAASAGRPGRGHGRPPPSRAHGWGRPMAGGALLAAIPTAGPRPLRPAATPAPARPQKPPQPAARGDPAPAPLQAPPTSRHWLRGTGASPDWSISARPRPLASTKSGTGSARLRACALRPSRAPPPRGGCNSNRGRGCWEPQTRWLRPGGLRCRGLGWVLGEGTGDLPTQTPPPGLPLPRDGTPGSPSFLHFPSLPVVLGLRVSGLT